MRRVGLAGRLALLAVALAVMAPVQVGLVRARKGGAGRLPVVFHRLLLRLLGVRVATVGRPPVPGEPTLILSNHVSWLDISVLSRLLPLSFIAKSEISGWPVVGALARLQRCIFVDRSRKAATAEVNGTVAARLAAGDAIVLFPEGTTGDGIRLLPFRSSLVGAARAALAEGGLDSVTLQPLALVYRSRNGLPIGRREMPDIAWYGDMALAPHLSAFLRGGPLDVLVVWGQPIPFGRSSDRKAASAAAEAAVRAARDLARSGTGPLPTATPGGLAERVESVA